MGIFTSIRFIKTAWGDIDSVNSVFIGGIELMKKLFKIPSQNETCYH